MNAIDHTSTNMETGENDVDTDIDANSIIITHSDHDKADDDEDDDEYCDDDYYDDEDSNSNNNNA